MFIDHHVLLAGWGVVVAIALAVLAYDLRTNNQSIPSLMQAVWALTVLYSGPIGLSLYWWAGRSQIATDSLWRRGARSTAHCYSGCGLGEIVGLVIATGVLALSTMGVAAFTFACAFLFGMALSVGPLLQDGMAFLPALRDSFYTETGSITVMEVSAITVDLLLAGGAGLTDGVFWTSMVVSLSVGYFAAYPVNVALIALGVKEGMSDPTDAHCH